MPGNSRELRRSWLLLLLQLLQLHMRCDRLLRHMLLLLLLQLQLLLLLLLLH